jgi:hypothetical protein
MSDAEKDLRCPHCNSEDVRRLTSACAVRSTGGGGGGGCGPSGRGFT